MLYPLVLFDEQLASNPGMQLSALKQGGFKMAQEEDHKTHPVLLTGFIAVVVIVSGLWVYQEFSLKSSRPIDKTALKKAILSDGRVEARLWQDPYEAIEVHQLKNGEQLKVLSARGAEHSLSKKPHSFTEATRAIKHLGVPSYFRLIPVFVDGNPYASGAESRLKDRYAVVSALGAAGYMPESREYIRFFTWQRQSQPPLTIPLELFVPDVKLPDKKREGYRKPVLIAWLKDQDFNPKPLAVLNELVSHVNEVFDEVFQREKRNNYVEAPVVYRTLGPRNSDTLRFMVKELQQLKAKQVKGFDALRDMKIYSPWATTEDVFLLDHLFDEKSIDYPIEQFSVEQLFKDAEIEFYRMIGTDAALAEQLIKELERRKVAFRPFKECPSKECRPQIALISEWDTLYGRSVPQTFAAVASELMKRDGRTDSAAREFHISINEFWKDEWPKWIRSYSYLAGLDGELPSKANNSETSDARTNETSKNSRVKEQAGKEWPEGRSQLDYIRRLAVLLQEEEARTGTKFEAIGVLGSDVYDKLLILQALRPVFPHILFFTTDLDAGLTEPSQWRWTRNVIVASHFGLELHPEVQGPVPPFRDSYQTAVFYAVSRALADFTVRRSSSANRGSYLTVPIDEDGKKFAVPRLYEIGRYGAFDISTDPLELGGNTTIYPPRPDRSLHNMQRAVQIASVCVFILFFVWLAVLVNNVGKNTSDQVSGIFDRATILLAILVATIMMGWVWSGTGSEGEPFTIFDGISVWPAVSIQLLTLILSITFLFLSGRELKRNERQLEGKFHLGDDEWEPLRGSVKVTSAWQNYKDLGKTWKLMIRGVPELLFVIVLLLISVFVVLVPAGPLLDYAFPQPASSLDFAFAAPCRGSGCYTTVNLVLVLSAFAMIGLMLYLINATRLCVEWIENMAQNMADNKLEWPPRLLDKEVKSRSASKENLNQCLVIDLIARRTDILGNLFYYPFIILFLMGMSHHSYFDNWDLQTWLLVLFLGYGGLVFSAIMSLRKSAARAKRKAIEQLENKLATHSDQTSHEKRNREQIAGAIGWIEHNHEGAFIPLSKHPVFKAIALPPAGYVLSTLIDHLITPF